MKKYCTKCGKQFEAVGREVICPACKATAAEETKRASVLRAKKASWAGESVPVRISGRASTVIRKYGEAHDVSFVEALDALLQSTPFFVDLGTAWDTIVPYKSHRRDKATQDKATQDKAQDAQEVTKAAGKPQDAPQEVKAAKATSKAKASKTAASKATSK